MILNLIVYIIYCFVVNSHKLSSLNQHTLSISQVLWGRSLGVAELGFLLRLSQPEVKV